MKIIQIFILTYIFLVPTANCNEESCCPINNEEIYFIFSLNHATLLKLYKSSLINNNLQDQLFSLTGLIKLHETSYNSSLQNKLINSTDAGIAHARRWLLFDKIGQISSAEKDFIISKKLLKERYGNINKASLKNLIEEIDKGTGNR